MENKEKTYKKRFFKILLVEVIFVTLILAGLFAIKKTDKKNYEKISKFIISSFGNDRDLNEFLNYFKK